MIDGSERILYLRVNGAWQPIACLTGNSISETVDTIGTTTRQNTGWSTFKPTKQSYTISFSANQDISVASRVTYNTLKSLKRGMNLIEWKLEAISSGLVDIGYGYIIDLEETADVGRPMTMSGTIRGYGHPTGYAVTSYYGGIGSGGDIIGVPNAPTEPDLTTTIEAPVLSLLSLANDSISMEWTVPSSTYPIKEFNIYRDDVLYTKVSFNGTGTTANFTDTVVAGTNYSYNVSAVDINNTEGPLSNRIINTSTVPDGGNNIFLYESFPDGGDIFAVKAHNLRLEDNDILSFEA